METSQKSAFFGKKFWRYGKKAVLSLCVIAPLPVRTSRAEGAFIEQQFE